MCVKVILLTVSQVIGAKLAVKPSKSPPFEPQRTGQPQCDSFNQSKTKPGPASQSQSGTSSENEIVHVYLDDSESLVGIEIFP